MAKSQITDKILFDALVQQKLATELELIGLLDKQKTEFRLHQDLVSGIAYLIDPVQGQLLVQKYPQQEEITRFDLGTDQRPRFVADDWDPWGSHALLATQDEGNRLETFEFEVSQPYGLVALEDKVYLYNNGHLETQHLGLAKHALYGAVYKGKPESSPFDLYLSANQQWLCIADRGAGSVSLLNLQTREMQGPVQIRNPGSTYTLNIAIDEANERALITDNQTASLYVLHFASMEVERQRLGLGILGNLVMAPEKDHAYLISVKPNSALHYLNIAKWKTEKEIKLKGDLFKADSSDPCDLLSVSPSGEYVLIMTYLNDPKPYTPVISVIEAKQAKTIRRYSLKDGVKPIQLAYGLLNPVAEYTRPLEELVIDDGLVNPQAMWSLKRELRAQLGEELDDEPAPLAVEAGQESEDEEEPSEKVEDLEVADELDGDLEADFLEIEKQMIDYSMGTKNDPDSDQLNITPKKSSKIKLPPAAIAEIVDILVTTFEKQVNQEVRELPEVMATLRIEAEEARKQLEDYDSVLIQIENLLPNQSLKTFIVREAIVMMLELQESIKENLRVVPTDCPNCNQPLNGSWDCSVCGFELESPDRASKRAIASADAVANLPQGHLVLPDPQGLRLLQLNPYKYVSWHLDPDQLSCQYPVDTLWLPNDNVLVVDKDGNAVLEVGLRGKVYWHFDTKRSEAHSLNEPVKITYFMSPETEARHYLIVDQGNHRVLEVNRDHEIIKEFGVKGIPGAEGSNLNTPSDVQFTHEKTYLVADTGNHRVIEYKENGGIENSWGEELKLNSPTCAQRLFNGHTLIVDSGNYRLLEIDHSGDIVRECLYYTSKVDPEFRVVSPIKMIRLLNKDVLIMDEDKLIQVMLHTNQLVWYSKIEDLAFQPKVDAPEIVVDEDGTERLVYKVIEHGDIRPVRLSQKINFKRMQKLIEARLRAEADGVHPDDGKSSHAADQLRSLIEDRKLEQRRNLHQELVMDSVHPSELHLKPGVELPPMRHYTLDRHHNAMIRLNRKGEVKWSYGFEMGQVLTRPRHFSETRRTLLVADTGNNRVVEISKADKEVILELLGPEDSRLGSPRSAVRLGMGRTLIADQRNKRLVELSPRGDIAWEYNKSGQIASPQYVEEISNGHLLFADSMLNSVREIDRDGNLCWSYGSRLKGRGQGQLFAPEFATRLANNHTLIADTRNNRVLEVNLQGQTVWSYEGDPVKRLTLLNPTCVERLESGNTLITYNNNREIVEVSPEGERLWWYKMGNDVFMTPVHGSARGAMQMVEKVSPYYNPIEKRLIRSAEEKAMWGMEIHVSLMDNTQMKSVRASLVLMVLENSGTVIKTFPSPEELLADKFGRDLIIAFILDPNKDPEELAEDVRYIAEVDQAIMERILFEDPVAAV